MNSMETDRQESIKNWFDNTYKTRGEFYLRPVKAYYIFLELLKVQPQTKLLDVACGLGRLLEAGKSYPCQLYGIDLSSVAVEKAQLKLPEATIVQGNAEHLPFPDNHFDYITCLGSLERMIDKEKVLKDMYRVTKKEAKICFLVRNAESFSWKFIKTKLGLKNQEGNQGARNLEDWTALFQQSGFAVEQVLPDQYPLHKRKVLMRLGLGNVDYKKTITSQQPLEKANEFLFILKKL